MKSKCFTLSRADNFLCNFGSYLHPVLHWWLGSPFLWICWERFGPYILFVQHPFRHVQTEICRTIICRTIIWRTEVCQTIISRAIIYWITAVNATHLIIWEQLRVDYMGTDQEPSKCYVQSFFLELYFRTFFRPPFGPILEMDKGRTNKINQG